MNNIKNKLIGREELNDIINNHLDNKVINVSNVDIFHQAFVHKSFLISESFVDEEDKCSVFCMKTNGSNERLEFLGDSILNMVTAEYLFMKYPLKDEGFLTKLRTKLVRNTQLSHMGSKLGFNQWLLISSSVEMINGRENPRLIEDVFESFIAAIYKDQGFYITKEFIFTCYEKYINLNVLENDNDNYKDTLLRYFQLNSWRHPVYDNVLTTGPKSNRVFTTIVLIDCDLCTEHADYNNMKNLNDQLKAKYNTEYSEKYIIGEGNGKTKKESEQDASKYTLNFLKVPYNF